MSNLTFESVTILNDFLVIANYCISDKYHYKKLLGIYLVFLHQSKLGKNLFLKKKIVNCDGGAAP